MFHCFRDSLENCIFPFQETQFWSKLVVEEGCVSTRSCADVCLLPLPRSDSSPANSLQFTKATRPHQSQFMFVWSPGEEVSDRSLPTYRSAHYSQCSQGSSSASLRQKPRFGRWVIGWALFAFETQQRCSR